MLFLAELVNPGTEAWLVSPWISDIPVIDNGSGSFDAINSDWPRNEIDHFVLARLERTGLAPSPEADRPTLIRRVTFDLTGAPPTREEVTGFLADERPSSEKRAALIDDLLAQKEFSELWVMSWAELLSIRSSNDISEKAALLYFEWLRDRIAENMPVDEMIRGLLTASGGTFSAPETNFYQTERDTLVLSENVAQSLLGIRVKCAQCHNHPFDRWTQDDYYGFAAFFAQVGRKNAPGAKNLPNAGFTATGGTEELIYDKKDGEVKYPNGVQAPPGFPYKHEGTGTKEGSRRALVSNWVTSEKNQTSSCWYRCILNYMSGSRTIVQGCSHRYNSRGYIC